MVQGDPLAHGYLSAVSVGLLLPLSIVLARNFKELTPAVRALDLLRRPYLAVCGLALASVAVCTPAEWRGLHQRLRHEPSSFSRLMLCPMQG